jgi:hypothetical protein
MDARDSFPGVKAAGAWIWPPPSSAEIKQCMELYLYSRNRPSWRSVSVRHNVRRSETKELYAAFTEIYFEPSFHGLRVLILKIWAVIAQSV